MYIIIGCPRSVGPGNPDIVTGKSNRRQCWSSHHISQRGKEKERTRAWSWFCQGEWMKFSDNVVTPK